MDNMEEEKQTKKPEPKSISPQMTQIILRENGKYCSTYLGNDVYYLVRSIYLMKSSLGNDYVKEKWEELGYNWKKTLKNLEKLNKKSMEAKAFYDSIEDKKGEKKNKELEVKSYFIKTASRVPMLIPEAYDLFVMLINESQLKRMIIPSDAFKILEHAGKKSIDLGKKPTTQASSESVN